MHGMFALAPWDDLVKKMNGSEYVPPHHEDYLLLTWQAACYCHSNASPTVATAVARPYYFLQPQLERGFAHKLPVLLLELEAFPPGNVPVLHHLQLFGPHAGKSVAPLQRLSLVDRWISVDVVRDTLQAFHPPGYRWTKFTHWFTLAAAKAAGCLIGIPVQTVDKMDAWSVDMPVPLEYLVVEVLLSQILCPRGSDCLRARAVVDEGGVGIGSALPTAEYYESVMVALWNVDPVVAPKAMTLGVEILFRALWAMDQTVAFQFARWLAMHISNFEYVWPLWGRWTTAIGGVDEEGNLKSWDEQNHQSVFIKAMIENICELSFAENMEGVLPKHLHCFMPAEQGPIASPYQATATGNANGGDDDMAGPANELFGQLLALIKKREPANDIFYVLKKGTEAMEEPIAHQMQLTTHVILVGAGPFLSSLHNLLEKYVSIFERIMTQGSSDANTQADDGDEVDYEGEDDENVKLTAKHLYRAAVKKVEDQIKITIRSEKTE